MTLSLLSFVALYAQNDVTKFLGIPVDGTKSEMIQKLKAKGFTPNSYERDVLEGEFNGLDVRVHAVTNNNKVYRIMVVDAVPTDERNIQIRFNKLCQQFANNSKYISLEEDYTIPDDEKISYEMTVHKKRYQAVFFQKPEIIDTVAVQTMIQSELLSGYTKEQLENLTDKEKEELQSKLLKFSLDYVMDLCEKKPVWFIISEEKYGGYSICMYYDNEYNHANGEDL